MDERLGRNDLIRYGGALREIDLHAVGDAELERLERRIDNTITWISGKREGLQENLTPLWRFVLDLSILAVGVGSFVYAILDWINHGLTNYGRVSVGLGVVATGAALLDGLPRMMRQRSETLLALDELTFELAWARCAGERIAREIHRRGGRP
jgi:hypothetical protein